MLGSPSTRSPAAGPGGPVPNFFHQNYGGTPCFFPPYSHPQAQHIGRPMSNTNSSSASSPAPPTPTAMAGNRSQRCGACEGCTSKQCGTCTYCQDSPLFGGPGVKKQSCIERRCRRVMENKLQREAPNLKVRRGCGHCPECSGPDCGICMPCQDRKYFHNKYLPGASCLRKRCGDTIYIDQSMPAKAKPAKRPHSGENHHEDLDLKRTLMPPHPFMNGHPPPQDSNYMHYMQQRLMPGPFGPPGMPPQMSPFYQHMAPQLKSNENNQPVSSQAGPTPTSQPLASNLAPPNNNLAAEPAPPSLASPLQMHLMHNQGAAPPGFGFVPFAGAPPMAMVPPPLKSPYFYQLPTPLEPTKVESAESGDKEGKEVDDEYIAPSYKEKDYVVLQPL